MTPEQSPPLAQLLPPSLGEGERSLVLAVVGDVHDQWTDDDASALQHLGVSLVLFVGDFGNESLDVVQAIANLPLPKAAIFGNHDAWYSAGDRKRRKCPYDPTVTDRVQQQLDLLGSSHVGFGCLNFPLLDISIVGARPFSWGGSHWKHQQFYAQRFGITSFADSAARIAAAAERATCSRLIFLGHNGPLGLGDRPQDPCGKDWKPIGGDHGDPDFAQALAQTQASGKCVSLVVFGHMHHRLRYSTQPRIRLCQDLHNTLYLNAAAVPRIVTTDQGTLHHFSLVSLQQGHVVQIQQVWVTAQGTIVRTEPLQPVRRENLGQGSYELLKNP